MAKEYSQKRTILTILIGIFLAFVFYNISLRSISLPFNLYEFEINAPDGTWIRNYSIFYDFNKNKGDINFKLGGDNKLKALDINLPDKLNINNIKIIREYTKDILVNNISDVKEFNGRRVWNNSLYIEDHRIYIHEIEGTLIVSLEIYSPDKSFYPNGVFKLISRVKDITPIENNRNEILTFNLGNEFYKYRCSSSFYVPERIDTEGIIPNCNEELLQLYINPSEQLKNLSGINRFILNTYNYNQKVWNDIFRSLAISIFAGTILFLIKQISRIPIKPIS